MNNDMWRTILRYGDSLAGMALLLSNHRAAAEAAAAAALTQVLTTPAATHPEHELYAALLQQRPQWRDRWRGRVLPPALARYDPLDRLLLGLWLVRNIDGPALAAITRQPRYAIIERLATILQQLSAPALGPPPGLACRVAPARWLETQLGFVAAPADHLRTCPFCRAAQPVWRARLDELRTTLHAAVKTQHLSLPLITAVADAVVDRAQPAPVAAWRRYGWLSAVLGACALGLALLLLPGRNTPAAPAAPLEPRALVQAALDGWSAPPADGTLYRQIRTLDGDARFTIDLWLGQDEAYRVETRNGSTLVGWQVAADGRLVQRDTPALSSCALLPGADAAATILTPQALSFRVTPLEQRAVRDAYLRQGGYGGGYDSLRQALHASDLRSLGVRLIDGRALTLLSYTNTRTEPRRRVVLQIDPATRQVWGVREITQAGPAAVARDVWQLLRYEPAATIAGGLPERAPVLLRERLIDPTCPSIKPDHVVSLRSLIGTTLERQYFAPALPPAQITSAAFVASVPRQRDSEHAQVGGGNLIFTGPDRWLSLSEAAIQTGVDPPDALVRGPWRISVRQERGVWQGTLRYVRNPQFDLVPALQLRAAGYEEDELLAAIATLQPFTAESWLQLHPLFVDPDPPPAATTETLARVLAALARPTSGVLYSETTTTTRANPQRVPTIAADPYAVPQALRTPAELTRRQWLVYDAVQPVLGRSLRTLPDGTLYEAQLNDGERTLWYDGLHARAWTGRSLRLPLFGLNELGIDLLATLLRSTAPIDMTAIDGTTAFEQVLRHSDLSTNYQFGGPREPLLWAEDLPPGTILRRLTLDPATSLPRDLLIVHRDEYGAETILSRTTLVIRRALSQPPADLLASPLLPPDAITLNFDRSGPPVIDTSPADARFDGRVLGWPSRNQIMALTRSGPVADWDMLHPQALSSGGWETIGTAAAWYSVRYKMLDAELILAQGPKRLMRNTLRNYSLPEGAQPRQWNRSQRLVVTIAEQPREAWLLQRDTYVAGSPPPVAALVVEVDNLLVHIAGPPDVLAGPLLDELTRLQWFESADPRLQRSAVGPSFQLEVRP